MRVMPEMEQNSSLRVAVIIPTHNRWAAADRALNALKGDDYSRKSVFLIDDGSTDGTADSCRKSYPEVTIIDGDGALWWSGAINLGLDAVMRGEFDLVAWLNDDNRVETNTLRLMVEAYLRCGDRSVICARTRSTATGLDEWSGEPPRWHSKWSAETAPAASSGPSDIGPEPDRPLEHPPGGRGVLIPLSCFREIGMVDQRNFPHYWADHDFHYRAMKAGYHYYLASGAFIWNEPNRTRYDESDRYSLRWIVSFLFSRRSPMNLPTLRRLLKRHLPRDEYRSTFYPLATRTTSWLASGWVARHPLIHGSLRSIRKTLRRVTGR